MKRKVLPSYGGHSALDTETHMIDAFFYLLSKNGPLLLFLVIGLGYLLGHVRIGGVSPGISAVLFIGLFLGAVSPVSLELPPMLYEIGLIIFVYMVGLQAGPGFFAALARRGLGMNLVAGFTVLFGVLIAVLYGYATGLRPEYVAGIFSGGMTNTPALAAAVEMLKSGADPEGGNLASLPIVGYSITYPFAVIFPIVSLYVLSRIWKVDFQSEASQIAKEESSDELKVAVRDFLVTNGTIGSKKIKAARIMEATGAVLSRWKRGGKVSPVKNDTVFQKGDVVVAVGSLEKLDAVGLMLGEESEEHIELDRAQMDFRTMYVSRSEIVGKHTGDLPIQELYGANITRVRRGDVEFVPGPKTTLEMGDRIRVVALREKMKEVSDFFGDSIKRVSETEIISPAFGMVLGVLVGMFPIVLPDGSSVSLGFAGGPLVVALVLGKLGRTGPMHWNIPQPVNLSLRQFGLLIFLAGVGLRAGNGFWEQFQQNGLELLVGGFLVTILPIAFSVILFRLVLKLDLTRISGAIAGIQTQPAVLASAHTMTGTDLPAVSYATVFPVVMILKIIAVQIILNFM